MKRLTTCSFAVAAAWLSLAGAAAAQPIIMTLNRTEQPRSGRLAIEGSGFGATGEVLVGGLGAWTTTWTETRIVAYVPETVPLGTAQVQVVTGGQDSNEVAINVSLRQADGRIRWTFETDGDSQWWRPALAPDGTLYLHTNNETEGLVYALAPDGALLWVQKVNWYPYVPPSAGPDGAVYVGSISTAYRISPSGDIDWTFDGQEITSSPTVGPDGRVYGAFEVQVGAFALDATTGTLEWSNDPDLRAWGMDGTEIVFGRSSPGGPVDRFYLYWDALWAFSLEGDHLWTGGTVNLLSHEPAIGSDGTIYAPGWGEAYLVAMSPDTGSILWDTNDPWLSGISDVEIGPDDTLYFISDGRWVDAYDPHARSSLWRFDAGLWLHNRVSLSPDASTVVVAGGGSQGELEVVKGFDASGGGEIFSVPLQEAYNPNFRHAPWHHARISADSSTAYVPTGTAQWPIHDGDPRATLFAIDITRAGDGCATDCLRSTRIDLRGRSAGTGFRVMGRVKVEDENGAAVANANVTVSWALPGGSSRTQIVTTGQSGQARLQAGGGGGTYTVTIVDISKPGYSFDPENSVLSKSITM